MKLWAALLHKEFDEQRGFLLAMAGGTVLLEAYASFSAAEHMGAALLAFLPLWAMLLLIPFRLIQSQAMEHRGQTLHLLLSLPVARSVPLLCKSIFLLFVGAAGVLVALAGIYIVYGEVEQRLQLPGLPQVSSEDLLTFTGTGALTALVLLVGVVLLLAGVALALRGVRTSLRWLGTAGFVVVLFIGYLIGIPTLGGLLGEVPLLANGLGRAYFAYNAIFGVGAAAIGLFLVETYSEA